MKNLSLLPSLQRTTAARFLFLLAAAGLCSLAQAHVSLQEPGAEPGSSYRAVLRVGHGCEGSATMGLALQLPPQLRNVKAEPREGWTLTAQAHEVRWTAARKEAGLPSAQAGEFAVNMVLPATPAPVWLKVEQICEAGRIDWSQVPVAGTSTQGLKTPAVLLDVAPAAAVKVEQAWVRPSVPGQLGTGGYMKLTARKPMRLLGVASPLAGVAEVHEMKMDGSVMTMRALAGPLDLPAGKAVELKPGGMHLMLMDLKQALAVNTVVPLTLLLQDEKGVQSRVDVRMEVRAVAPAAAPGTHQH